MNAIHHSRFAALLLAIGVGPVAGSAYAAPTISDDESAFLAHNPIVATEDFSTPTEYPPEQKSVVFQKVRYSSTDALNPWRVVEAGPSTGARLFRRFSDGMNTADLRMDFEGGSSVTAFGFRLVPFGTPNQFVILIEGRNGSTTTINMAPAQTNAYVGATDPDGIVAVTITQQPDLVGGTRANFGLASAARSAVQAEADESRPKIIGAGLSLAPEVEPRRMAAMAVDARAMADGSRRVHPTLGVPVTVWKAEGQMLFAAQTHRYAPIECFRGAVVCMAKLFPASVAGTGHAAPELWEIRAMELAVAGPRYRSLVVQDGESAGFVVAAQNARGVDHPILMVGAARQQHLCLPGLVMCASRGSDARRASQFVDDAIARVRACSARGTSIDTSTSLPCSLVPLRYHRRVEAHGVTQRAR